MLPQVVERLEVGCREMTDVEVHLEQLRHLHRGGEAVGRRKLVRIAGVRMAVHGNHHLVLLGDRRNPLRDVERRRRRDDLGAEGFRHLEAAVDLGVGEARVRAVVVRVNDDAGRVEFLPDVAEVIERRLEPPLPRVFARFHRLGRRRIAAPASRAGGKLRLHLRRPQLAVADAAVDHRLDDRVDRVAARRPRQIAEAVGLRAEADAVDDRIDCRARDSRQRQRETRERHRSEFTSCVHMGLTNPCRAALSGPPRRG